MKGFVLVNDEELLSIAGRGGSSSSSSSSKPASNNSSLPGGGNYGGSTPQGFSNGAGYQTGVKTTVSSPSLVITGSSTTNTISDFRNVTTTYPDGYTVTRPYNLGPVK